MPTTTITTTNLRARIADQLDDLVAIRRDLHRHPELGYEETRTSGVVQRELEAAGIEFACNLGGGTGVLGHLPGDASQAVGLRADMDALPITERTGAPYASVHDGVMHACGHDGHTTMLLGAARVLASLAEDGPLPRPVTLVFQPAEEGGAGGRRMVEDGCLDGSILGPPVESMFGAHGWPRLPLGCVGTRPGPLLAAADMFDVEITGTQAHAAFPHLAHDPIVAASAIVTALQTIASRNVDPLDPIVVTVAQIEGGTAHNIIPESARLSGTVRTLTAETQTLAVERLQAIAESVARAHGCTAAVDYKYGYPVTRNDPATAAIVTKVATDAFGPDRYQEVPRPYLGGEDFAFYAQRVPACFFILGLQPPDAEPLAELHQPAFDFNDDAIATGVEMFCRLALR